MSRNEVYLRNGIRISHGAYWFVSWNLQHGLLSVVGQEQALRLAVFRQKREMSRHPPATCVEPLLEECRGH